MPFTFREGTLAYSNLGLKFRKIRILYGNSVLSLDGSIEEGNLNLSSSGTIDLKPLHSLLQTSFFSGQLRSQVAEIQQMAGRAEVRLKWLGKIENWSDTLREGEIKLKAVSVQHQAIPVPFSYPEGFRPGCHQQACHFRAILYWRRGFCQGIRTRGVSW